MSKLLWCGPCARDGGKQEGTRRVYEGADHGDGFVEPDEYERCVFGLAKVPNPADRVMYINDVPFPMPLEHFICDHCGQSIMPGSKCMGWTIWRATEIMPSDWEDDYLERSPQ